MPRSGSVDAVAVAKRKRAGKFRFLLGIGLLILAGAVAYWLIEKHDPLRHVDGPKLEQDRGLLKRRNKAILSSRENHRRAFRKKMLAVIIDDIGHDQDVLKELLKINQPITFAILPYCRYSVESAERVHRAGREILLHLPMEPHGYPEVKPGEGALLSSMNLDDLSRELLRDLKAVPYARGVNNHMGSKLMEDEGKLRSVFRTFGQKKLFFVDSLTTGQSRGREAARSAGIPFAQRDAFLDNNDDPEAVYRELVQAVRGEGNWNKKILIGHPYPATVRALKKISRMLPSDKVELVPVSRIADVN